MEWTDEVKTKFLILLTKKKPENLRSQIVNQLPQEFNELVYYILMDECFEMSYPHIRERLLTLAEKFDTDNYSVYLKSTEVCSSFSAACQVLTINENLYQVKRRIVLIRNKFLFVRSL